MTYQGIGRFFKQLAGIKDPAPRRPPKFKRDLLLEEAFRQAMAGRGLPKQLSLAKVHPEDLDSLNTAIDIYSEAPDYGLKRLQKWLETSAVFDRASKGDRSAFEDYVPENYRKGGKIKKKKK